MTRSSEDLRKTLLRMTAKKTGLSMKTVEAWAAKHGKVVDAALTKIRPVEGLPTYRSDQLRGDVESIRDDSTGGWFRGQRIAPVQLRIGDKLYFRGSGRSEVLDLSFTSPRTIMVDAENGGDTVDRNEDVVVEVPRPDGQAPLLDGYAPRKIGEHSGTLQLVAEDLVPGDIVEVSSGDRRVVSKVSDHQGWIFANFTDGSKERFGNAQRVNIVEPY